MCYFLFSWCIRLNIFQVLIGLSDSSLVNYLLLSLTTFQCAFYPFELICRYSFNIYVLQIPSPGPRLILTFVWCFYCIELKHFNGRYSMVGEHRICSLTVWVSIPFVSLPCCVTSGNLLNISIQDFPDLENGGNSTTYSFRLLWRLNWLINIKHLEYFHIVSAILHILFWGLV